MTSITDQTFIEYCFVSILFIFCSRTCQTYFSVSLFLFECLVNPVMCGCMTDAVSQLEMEVFGSLKKPGLLPLHWKLLEKFCFLFCSLLFELFEFHSNFYSIYSKPDIMGIGSDRCLKQSRFESPGA